MTTALRRVIARADIVLLARAGLSPHAGVLARADAERHQALPVPRPGAPRLRRALVVGHPAVRGLGAAPDDLVPLAVGPVVLVVRDAGRTGVDRPPAVARHAARGRWPRRALARPPARPHRRRRTGCRAHLPALAVHPSLRLADLAHAAAVGRPRLAHRADDAGRAAGRLAPPGDHRPRPRDRRRPQRDGDPHDRARARAVARPRHRSARDRLAAGARHGRPHRRARAPDRALVDVDALGAGPLRRRRARLLRVPRGGVRHRPRARDHPRHGLLARLRARPVRRHHHGGARLHVVAGVDRDELRPRHHRRRRPGDHAMVAATLRRRVGARRNGARGRRLPDRRSVAADVDAGVELALGPCPRAAQQHPGATAQHARPRPRRRRLRRRPRRLGCAGDRAAGRRGSPSCRPRSSGCSPS